MPIPKVIYQTFKNDKLPFVTRQFISLLKAKNPSYRYEFFDDSRIIDFFKKEYDSITYDAYNRIAIGAVKADFFRYAVLYKYGGVYLDIDGYTLKNLDHMILSHDDAIITRERNPDYYAQYALIFCKDHPFLKRTIEICVDNILHNRFPNSGHAMTGPAVYTQAIEECIAENPNIPYRIFGVDYEGYLKSRHPLRKRLYKKGEHWQQLQQVRTVLKTEEEMKITT